MISNEDPSAQVIPLARRDVVTRLALFVCGLLLACGLALSIALVPDPIATAILDLSVIVFGGGIIVGTGWHLLNWHRRLIIGAEQIEHRIANHVLWQVRYREIDKLALFMGFLGAPYLGIRLREPAQFDRTRPKLAKDRAHNREQYGFDLGLRLAAATEPPERILEAALRCLHRYRAEQGASPCDCPAGDLRSNQADLSDLHPDGAFRETHPDRR